MILAKLWYHTAIICAKKVLTQLKIVYKLKLCSLQLQVTTTIQHYFNFYQ